MPFMQRMTAGQNKIHVFIKYDYSHVQLYHHIPTEYDMRIWREKRKTNKVQV